MKLQDHAKPVYCTIIDDDDGDGGGGGGEITPSEPIGNIPTGIPTKLPGYFRWTDIIRCALYKINGPSQGELLQPFTELERNLADRIMDFATPIKIVKGISYARRGGADDDYSKKKKKKKNESEKRLLANSSKMSYRMEKKLQAMWDNIFGIQKQETSEIKGKTNRDEIKKETEKEKEKRKPPTTAIARIVKRRRIPMNGQTVEIKKQFSSAETKPKTETTNKAAEKENPPDEVECTEQKDGVMKNQSHSFSGRSSSMVVSNNDRKLEKKQQCPPSWVSHEKPNKIIKSRRTTVEDIGYRKAMNQFSYLWSQRKKEQEKQKQKATTSSSSSSLRSSSTTTSIRPNVMKKQHHISSTTNFHNTPSAYHSKPPPPPSSSSSSSDFRSDRMKKALGVKVGIQPYKKTSNVEGPRSLVGSKVGIQRPPTRFLNTEKQAKLISSSSTATSSSKATTTNPNLSNKITRNLMPISKTPFVNNSQKILTKINRFQM